MAEQSVAEELQLIRRDPRWVTWLWGAAGWTALALFLGVSSSLAYMSVGNPPRWSLTIRMALAETYVWALLAPLVAWLSKRFPFTRATLVRSLAVHAATAIVLSVAKVVADRLIRATLFGLSSYLLWSSTAPNFLFYWGIVAAVHGMGYYRASKEKELRASQLEARLARARLQLLQMQLHPHFLFNTLNAISELVHEDPEKADRMITGLSDLLRETLAGRDTGAVPLRRELALLQRYLDIQQARFGDRLRIDIEVDPAVANAAVPHFILQPLVENSIRHGIGARAGSGSIRVRARAAGGQLIVRIEDDGPGIEAGSLVQDGIGLGNTRARLLELYGTEHSLDVESPPQGGVSVTVAVPLRMLAE
jgi:two-component system, LytTR family, sensor kinase